jgi:AcrR family transcriptional regulator
VVIGARYGTILDASQAAFARVGFHQASIREIARATRLSLAGLYHYVGGKDELLFLVLARALDTLLGMADAALADARTPQTRLLALIRAHLEYGFGHPDAQRVINRDWELVAPAHRGEIVARRRAYMDRWLRVLAELDPCARPERELFSATNLVIGMLNGIAVPTFLRTRDDPRALAAQVSAIFLHGFLEPSGHAAEPVPIGGAHDA